MATNFNPTIPTTPSSISSSSTTTLSCAVSSSTSSGSTTTKASKFQNKLQFLTIPTASTSTTISSSMPAGTTTIASSSSSDTTTGVATKMFPVVHRPVFTGSSNSSLFTSTSEAPKKPSLLSILPTNNYEKIKKWIKNFKITVDDLNRLDNSYTPLMFAVENHYLNSMQALIEAGADINLAGYEKLTPLHLAAKYNFSDVVEYLIKKDASLDSLDQPHKMSPLHHAAINGCLEPIRLLVEAGARRDLKDSKDFTPLDLFEAYLFQKGILNEKGICNSQSYEGFRQLLMPPKEDSKLSPEKF